ncbi:MAG TPA: NAD(+) synthase [Bacilli bacterium]|nr:NAD(+) synthase [Bacilli bacterium]HPS18695.1 NAD(+) synthase [Bacilli bacterium]
MILQDYLQEIKKFLKDTLTKTNMSTYVLGLSGGIDSSLTAVLATQAVGREKLMCIMIPIDSHPDDLKDAIYLAKQFDLRHLIIDGSNSFHETVKQFKAQGIELSSVALANLKVRIRMTILYAYAQTANGLVLGTDNKDERYTGYFTKYGDGAVDLMPIVHLVKSEVLEAAKLLGVPDYLVNRVPSAGLFPGQTDEKEMGVTYRDLDRFLLGKEIDETAKKRIDHLHEISRHKRDPIPTPIDYIREKDGK